MARFPAAPELPGGWISRWRQSRAAAWKERAWRGRSWRIGGRNVGLTLSAIFDSVVKCAARYSMRLSEAK